MNTASAVISESGESLAKSDFLSSTGGNWSDLRVTTVDMHVGGDPLRIVTSGIPEIEGDGLLQKLEFFTANFGHVKRILLCEPRGHLDMFAAVLVKPDLPGADIAVIILNNSGDTVTFCGHSVIALARFAVDHGYVKATEPETAVGVQYPCGVVKTRVEYKAGQSGSVTFQCVPAFVYATDVEVDVAGFGKLKVDISYGGMFYGFLSGDKVGVDLATTPTSKVKTVGGAIIEALRQQVKVVHPDGDDLAILSGVIITDGRDQDLVSLQCCVIMGNMVARAPCGSGTTARVALQHHRGQTKLDETKAFVSSVTGSHYTAMATGSTRFAGLDAVIVEVNGRGYYTGTATFVLEEDDPLKHGFLVK